LEILGPGRDEHALTAEDRGDEVGERLAGPGAGLREQHAALGEDSGDGRGHLELARAGLEPRQRSRDRAAGGKRGLDRRGFYRSGYSGNFRHSTSTSTRTAASTPSSSGEASARA